MNAAQVFARLGTAQPPATTPVVLGTAVVLGGSIAGLLAARVLSDHADTVVVIDRDDPGASADPRPGVPQGAQIHALLPGGLVQLERWFPGFAEEALAEGARPAPPEIRGTYLDGVRKVRGSSAMMLTGTRPFLESLIRRRTLALPNVKTITARVTGLEFTADAVTGVHYESDGAPGAERADFVVDAMGRSSRLGEWLAQAGWERPPMRRMTVDLNYATALLPSAETDPDVNGLVALRSPDKSPEVAGAALCQVEGDRWMIMLAGYVDHRPGRTAEDLVHLCRTEFPPEFGQVAGNGVIGDVGSYRHADSRRRDFHLLTRLPAGLAAVGDAVASFNPVYGQGMSSAALHASCLSEYLRSEPDLTRPARGFFALQRVVVDAAWDISTGADLALPHVDGPYPRGYRVLSRLNTMIVAASAVDPVLARKFDEVTFMRAHPSTLATPGVLVRALLVNLRMRLRRR
ncbi:MAG TPA: FAD-dependent oxidoreductase [Pseudonocardiaceae bacterium]|nr:FAD-dependent oxidoreductase [Pseudonocardiaceae bacterium]